MDSPGYDPASATGQIAGGANLIMVTTGRGPVFGSLPAPTLKLASNAGLATALAEDIDIDCSSVLDGQSLESIGAHISLCSLVRTVLPPNRKRWVSAWLNSSLG